MTADATEDGRVTAPQQPYSGTDVIMGFVVLGIGLFVVAGFPYIF
ncbi:MAG: hypothetical protein ABEJ77_02450 [Halanaeroarchaeum sp.]